MNNSDYISIKELLSPFAVRQFKLWAMNPENIHRRKRWWSGEYYDKTSTKVENNNVWWK